MFKKFHTAVFSLAFVAAASGAYTASAATVRATYSGTVSGSSDMTGLFGAPGGSLDGQAFSLTYTFSTSAGFRDNGGPGTYDAVFGGKDYGMTSPTLSAQLTIAGHSQTVSGASGSTYYVCDAAICGENSVDAEAYDIHHNFPGTSILNLINVTASGPAGAIPTSLETPFALSALTGGGNFLFQSFSTSTWSYVANTYGDLNVTHVSVSVAGVAPVPLPAAVGPFLLVLGLGGLGGFVARRRGQRGQV